jgi:putative NADH-flavin reductase
VLDWTFLSPPALLAPGERSGGYRVGGEDLLMAGAQPAGISVADLAVAIVDEIEQPRHVRARFTVAAALA